MSKLKYFDGTNWNEVNGNIVGDTLPIGTEIIYDGQNVPVGWEQIAGKNYIAYDLYNNPSGTTSTISTLSDNVENYDYIEIYFKTNDTGSAGSTKIISSTSGTKVATLFYIWFVGTTDYVKSATINVSQKTITFKSNVQYQNFSQRESGSFVYITKVVGYKEA